METPFDTDNATMIESAQDQLCTCEETRLPGRLTATDQVLLGGTASLSLLEGLLQLLHSPAWLSFLCSALTLTVLSVLIGQASDQISEHCSPWLAAFIQASLGNIPELFFSLFALHAGLTSMVQYALVGSALGTSVLVLGCAFLLGGWRYHRSLLFSDEPAQNMVFTLIIAIAGIAIASLLQWFPSRFTHPARMTFGIACLLLLFFVGSTIHFLSLKRNQIASTTEELSEDTVHWPIWLAGAVLAGSMADAAYISEAFVGSLTPAIDSLHLSPLFVGVIVVPLAGNVVEHVLGVLYAWKNKTDLAISSIYMSSIQVLDGLFPLLVLISFLPGFTHLTFAFPVIPLVALSITPIIVNHATYDGRGNTLEGGGLLVWYGIMMLAFLWT